jgi:hypothetical protein
MRWKGKERRPRERLCIAGIVPYQLGFFHSLLGAASIFIAQVTAIQT